MTDKSIYDADIPPDFSFKCASAWGVTVGVSFWMALKPHTGIFLESTVSDYNIYILNPRELFLVSRDRSRELLAYGVSKFYAL